MVAVAPKDYFEGKPLQVSCDYQLKVFTGLFPNILVSIVHLYFQIYKCI